MTRKIAFLTGTRADFGKLKPLIRAVENCPDFESHTFVTGMHTLSKYGMTLKEIEKAKIENIHVFTNQFVGEPMDLVLANTIGGFARWVAELQPDLIVVHGDRVEALGAASVGALRNILVAHIEGGELSGTIDGTIRHAVTKLSHLHFVANDEAARRLQQLGEAREQIFVIGSPDIDVMLDPSLPSIDRVRDRYEIDFDEYAIALFHPVTTESEGMEVQAEAFVDALLESQRQYVVIYPNNDAGAEDIFRNYERLEGQERFQLFPSMRFEYFLTLLKHSKFIVGNSSAGIREAPVYGIYSIDVGSRQKNRFSYKSVIDVENDTKSIVEAIDSIGDRPACEPSQHFGRGDSARRFLETLKNDDFWDTPASKQFVELASLEGMSK